MDEWGEIQHAKQNISRNVVLLSNHAGSIERRQALTNIEMQVEILAVAVKEAKEIFTNG